MRYSRISYWSFFSNRKYEANCKCSAAIGLHITIQNVSATHSNFVKKFILFSSRMCLLLSCSTLRYLNSSLAWIFVDKGERMVFLKIFHSDYLYEKSDCVN